MYLHEDKDLFKTAISNSAYTYHLEESYVEKDYYLFLVLKELSIKLPTLMFKGGTSLSKCQKVINRFSEDLDISLAQERINKRPRKRVKEAIKAVCLDLGLEITNLEHTESDKDYNKYIIDFHQVYESPSLKPYLSIETVYMVKNYPFEQKSMSSFIGDYLCSSGNEKLAKEYNLEPFMITTQTLSRTLADKIFALCDYYLENRITRNSRHIYDIYKILQFVPLDDDFKILFNQVREDRIISKSKTPSASRDIDIPLLLQEIIEKDIYKEDYLKSTSLVLYEDISYEKALTSLKDLIDSKVLQ
ncbi:MAG: nucleotidyl transferase AbiEii/AbiGii toxin family protein [Coprobacillus sp.]|nr:nucleotidyl transferase AbiEii/AbiGii toxin family protein [Coprobacillus sp.]